MNSHLKIKGHVAQRFVIAGLAAVLLNAGAVSAAKFGGPDAVENTIEADATRKPAAVEERLLDNWFDWIWTSGFVGSALSAMGRYSEALEYSERAIRSS